MAGAVVTAGQETEGPERQVTEARTELNAVAEVWKALDALRGQVIHTFEYQLTLRVVALSALAAASGSGADEQNDEVVADGWLRLVDHAQRVVEGAMPESAETVLREVWDGARITERVGLAGRGLFDMPQLSEDASQRLSKLILAVHQVPSKEDLFAACLDLYSRRMGKGGDYFTPQWLARLMVELAGPRIGERVLDPACGSGGLLVEAARQVRSWVGDADELTLVGRDVSSEARQVAALNLATHGLRGDLGRGPIDSLNSVENALECDVALVNPPFNASGWAGDAFEHQRRWRFGAPPRSSANFAWLQHTWEQLSSTGLAVVLLADGAATGTRLGEQVIRQRLVEADALAALIALPSDLFPHNRNSACLWILSKDKGQPRWGHNPRREQVLFIDARTVGKAADRGRRVFTGNDIHRICATFASWRADSIGPVRPNTYEDEDGWCRSVSPQEIKLNGYDLKPAHYVPKLNAGVVEPNPATGTRALTAELYALFDEARDIEWQLRTLLDDA
ncbi:N-6 DNA methylase [Streptomyces sp. NPDC050658]|uniref:N-6 DNA methylase n=1 Tax=unclassified Streptomyces TaxID=2593676 RepID=UPI003426302D